MSRPRAARRRVGRPRPIAGVAARELLLDAAVVLFSEQGVAGTTVAEIAAKAGMTQAMVHYYFTNKSRLLDAIAKERVLRVVSSVWAPVSETNEVVPMLRGLVRRIVHATEVNPWLPSLWLREIISEGGQLRSRLLRNLPVEQVGHLLRNVAAAQQRGELSPDVEPRLALLSVLGLTMLPLATMRVWNQIPLLKGITRQDIARHAEALLVNVCSGTRTSNSESLK
ncbi:MAG: TetR/AcrR family transcriptional regulator [Sinobacteraceae bacterium]|nr:TetR/AcrR family transcriptional regulator [Nevskiaceae bacterium]